MRSLLTRLFLSVVCLLLGFSFVQAQTAPILFQHPTVDATQIVFSYAGSLWSVSRSGGVANRLTPGDEHDTSPIFSPDGKLLAFTSAPHGNEDVYVMPAEGGPAQRLTWHPGPNVTVGWTNDSKQVLFKSTRLSVDPLYFRLLTVPVTGGMPSALPLPWATQGSYSPDGQRLAYVPFRNHPWFEAWKHYHGGMQPRIRIAELSDSSVTSLPRGGANNNNKDPMWIGGAVYFLSDRTGGHFRLYRYDVGSKTVKAISPEDGHDILTATAGALNTSHPAIVYAEMGKLFLVDVRSGKVQQIHVAVHVDFPAAHPRWETVAKQLRNPDISPHGVRAVFQAHCDIVTVPTKHGSAQDISNTTGACERYPAWSPDGSKIAFFSDASGENELYISPQNGIGSVHKISLGAHPTFYFDPVWSPDGSAIAFSDIAQHLWIVDVKTGKMTLVATRYYDEQYSSFHPAWSADSQWLTYTADLPNHLHAIDVYSLASGKSTRITPAGSDARLSQFDPSGKYLYFLASTNPNPGAAVGDLSSIDQPTVYSAYVVVLRKDIPSPLAPRPGEEKATKPESSKKKKGTNSDKDKKKPEKPAKVTIDFEGLSERILALPMPPRSYKDLRASAPGVLWLLAGPVVSQNLPDHPGVTVYRFSMKKRKAKQVLAGIDGFVMSADGKKMLIEQHSQWRIVPAEAKIAPTDGTTLNTGDLKVYVDPHREWGEMYRQVWRLEQHFFYSPQFNGLDLPRAEKYYAQFLPGVEDRSDLMYLFHDMVGNLSVSHMFLVASHHGPKPTSVGLLGAEYTVDHNRYRFSHIYSGENWNPGLHAPLTQPGVNVKVGDYLLEVNGRPLYGTDNLYSFFQDTAGKQVVLTVAANPDGTDSRQVTVVPVPHAMPLRKEDWVHRNQMLVDKLSDGKLAYIYLPDTANGGWTYFNRYFYSQIGKQGAVVDERFNHGGDLANYVINQLQQPLLSFWVNRYGQNHTGIAPAAIFGPKVMIINHFAGSGGDYMPYIFRQQHVGQLVGTRTWGGLVGIDRYPALMDGSMVTAPDSAIYFPNGKWDVENHGVAPDVRVTMNPELWRKGQDPQLEAAVAIAMRELKAHPFHMVPPPPYPNRNVGMPLGIPATTDKHPGD
ncbi:MAG TPA: PDZ domain-containing protein [Acidobacteriaceae bacterium]|nr:PDZ domain-containing protein [Acidobacteriaceae bacterium]